MRFTTLLTAATLLVGVAPVYAETITLDEVLITGEAVPPNEDRVTGRDIKESPAKDVGEALKALPGLDIVRKGAIANDIVMRGLRQDNLNVLLDGMRLYGGCPSRMDPPSSHIDFAEVDEIHVLRGPYDLENGGLGGTVNVKTRPARESSLAELNLSYGSFDAWNASGMLSGTWDRLSAQAGYSFKNSGIPVSGGGKPIIDVYAPSNANRFRSEVHDSNAYEMHTSWLKLGFQPGNARMELDVANQSAHHVLYPYLMMDAASDVMNRINWSYEQDQTKVQAYWNRVDHVMDNRFREASRGTPDDYTMRTDAVAQTFGAKASSTLPLMGGTLRGGLDAYSRNWNNTTVMYNKANGMTMSQPSIPDVTLQDLGVFAEYALKATPQLSLKGGLRGDLARTQAAQLDENRLGFYRAYFPEAQTTVNDAELSGNLQAAYALTEAVELFGGLARGVRMPDPQERFIGVRRGMGANWLGNPKLRPSKNHQADVGLRYRGESLNVSATVFNSNVQDFIDLATLPDPDGSGAMLPAKSYQNVDARLWGGELAMQAALPLDFFLLGGLSYVEGQNLTGNRPLSEMPPLKAVMGLRYDREAYFVEAVETFAARQDRVDPSLNEAATPGWMTTDLRAGVKWGNTTLSAGVKNLFDVDYATHLSYQRDPFAAGVKVPESGRNVYLSLSQRF